MSIEEIAKAIENDLKGHLDACGIMFRIFSRVKTPFSLAHKMSIKGDKYKQGHKIQDIIGIRIVVYFPDDIEVAELLVNRSKVLDRSIDEPDSCTFQPSRLNITCHLPEQYVDEFREQLPVEYAQYIDDSYEVQIRTIYSEGWHEVEHDFRYKCKEDWVGYEDYSRTLNGVIATLETAEWSIKTLFMQMSYENYRNGNYNAMLRNHLRIRLKGNGLSPELITYLKNNRQTALSVCYMDRLVFLFSLLCHKSHISLDYDTALFLINRLDVQDMDLMLLESPEMKKKISDFLMDK